MFLVVVNWLQQHWYFIHPFSGSLHYQGQSEYLFWSWDSTMAKHFSREY